MASPFDLSGRCALVTGASRGIGLAIAHAFAEHGAEVVLTGRKADTLEAAAAEVCHRGQPAHAIVCHQGEPAAIAGLFQELDRRGLSPDIVVANAATNPVMGPLLNVDLAAWRKIMDVNLTGAFVTAQEAARRMVAKGRGSIIFVASVAGVEPSAGIGAYSVSKAGMLGLMKAFARELGPQGVRVNALAPGLVETQFAAAFFRDPAAYKHWLEKTPLQRHGQPKDIVGAALFLASDASSYMTGQAMIIDGGGRV